MLTTAGAAAATVQRIINDQVATRGESSTYLELFLALLINPSLEEFLLASDISSNLGPAEFLADVVTQCCNSNSDNFSFCSPKLPVIFCSNYDIGALSDQQLQSGKLVSFSLINSFCPRVSGTGLFANSSGKEVTYALQTILTKCLGGAGIRGWLTL